MKLLFVYNAKSGLFNSLADSAHKMFSPDTYECNLCKLTYGNVLMKRAWRDFIRELPFEVEFMHKDLFKQQYDTNYEFPALFALDDGALFLKLSADEISKADSLKELISIVKANLN